MQNYKRSHQLGERAQEIGYKITRNEQRGQQAEKPVCARQCNVPGPGSHEERPKVSAHVANEVPQSTRQGAKSQEQNCTLTSPTFE